MSSNNGIAIVGMDCRYAGAQSVDQYWENILSLRQQFRRIPDKRLNLKDYLSTDRSNVDSTYSEKAAVLLGYSFDRVKYKVGKSTYEQTDLAHWLALDVACGALKDAGFENGEGLDKKRVGVVLGNSLTGEFTRANVMRLRWPYVSKVLETTLTNLQYSVEDMAKIISTAERNYKVSFPEPNADTLAGGLSNTIAGRICNYFDFNGGGFTIDGACASSLLAFANGCNALRNGELDAVLVGGVDLSIDPFEVIGFARNGALAANEMEVYSNRSEGFWPGEGCGIAVLMKESEARRLGLKIYSVIKGWGISSDGNGGITRPKAETQQIAFDRAYELAGYDISSVSMFEGHGTGTPLGDKTEITALVNSLKQYNKKGRPAIVGSVKHLIGHTKAAAGVAGVIKAALALKNGIIPPSRPNVPNAVLQENESILQLAKTPMPWCSEEPMRASVLSMGFGGINVHLTMEENSDVRKLKKLPTKISKLAESFRDVEMFPISANSGEALLAVIEKYAVIVQNISRAELVDFSSSLCASFHNQGKWRACIVARTPDSLLESLNVLKSAVTEGNTRLIDPDRGIFFDATTRNSKLVFLFPGQGAPVYPDSGIFKQFLKHNTPIVAGVQNRTEIVDTSIAQPAIVNSTLKSVELLERFGVEADFGIGHSLGEISALTWAGAIKSEDAVEIARARGQAMSEFGVKGSGLLALKCKLQDVERLINGHEAWITGYNGNGNFVVGGDLEKIADIQNKAFEEGIHCVKLKVSHAFHTPFMKEASIHFKNALSSWEFERLERKVSSTITGSVLHADTNIKNLLFQQIESPVLLTQALENVRDEALFFFEVGPGSTLSKSLSEYKNNHAIALDFGSDSLKGFFNILAAAFVNGSDVRFEELSVDRFYRQFDHENWALDVLVNPCEALDYKTTISYKSSPGKEEISSPSKSEPVVESEMTKEGVERLLKKVISEKTEIPVDFINASDKIMSQLHINSLAITEIISQVIKTFNKSQKVFSAASIIANSDGTIAELSEVIFKGENGSAGKAETEVNFGSAINWTHIFKRQHIKKNALSITIQQQQGIIIVSGKHDLKDIIEDSISRSGISIGNAAVYVYSSQQDAALVEDFIRFVNQDTVRQCQLVVLVDIFSDMVNCDLKPILKTLHLEAPGLMITSVEVHEKLDAKEQIVVDELSKANKFREVIFDKDGLRYESELECFFPKQGDLAGVISESDVILATGGGKGITFESILALTTATQAKALIIGRSLPEQDTELANNLDRLRKSKITFRYYSADVSNAARVTEVVQNGIQELGPVTVCLHGAGYNKPKSLSQLTSDDFKNSLAIKLGGLQNVIASIDETKLRLLLGYGSIIGESGMQGNADYAWANQKLARFIADFGVSNPQCRCIAFEWSVWDETGMGVSMNLLDNLKQRGVWPISISKGVDILKAIIADKECGNGNYIISGRYGSIPTLNYKRSRLPLGRFVSKIKHHIPGIEAVSDVSINLKDDVYLTNHVFQNQYVFPTVMILEGVAQVCNILSSKKSAWTFEHLKINKSIFVSASAPNTIRFIVTRVDEHSFYAIVQSEDSNFETNCFEVTIKLDSEQQFTRQLPQALAFKQLEFDVDNKFYKDLLFHKGPFRRIKSFIKIQALESLAIAESSMLDEWFSSYMPNTYLLGDPGLNDAAIHCHQACRPGFSLLPTGAERIGINTTDIEGPFFIETIETHEEANNTFIDVYVYNKKGEVKIFWKNLVLTQVTGTSFKGDWDPHLLVPYIEYNVNKLSRTRNNKLPLESCFGLIESLRKQGSTEKYSIDGYTVSLKKQKHASSDAAVAKLQTGMAASSMFSSELQIVSLDEKVLLEICPR